MTSPYGLTRDMADAIVGAVKADPACRLLLPKVSAFRFFAPIGHAGTSRNLFNWGMELRAASYRLPFDRTSFAKAAKALEDYWRDTGDAEACTGVATATARALTRVAGSAGYDFLKGAGPQDRMPGDPARDFHTATAVTVTGDRRYVFDWHATLDIAEPLIFPSVEAFKQGRGAVKYGHFWGWS